MRAVILAAVVVALSARPLPAMQAQQASTLSVADAGSFMGTWSLQIQDPVHNYMMTVALTNVGGKVAGQVSWADGTNPMQQVTNISKSGKNLVLNFTYLINGVTESTKLTMFAPSNGSVAINLSSSDKYGSQLLTGTASKQ